jgi:hypothetical protein
MRWKSFVVILTLVWAGSITLRARGQAKDEDHKLAVAGIEIGMDAQSVMAQLHRNADAAKDEGEHTYLTWKMPDGNLLKIDFWMEHVAGMRLTYKVPRPATDLWLVPLKAGSKIALNQDESAMSESKKVELPVGNGEGTTTALTAADPRWRREYKVTETNDQTRIVWTRDEKSAGGYSVQIIFWSTSKKEKGERYGEYVAFKDVLVAPNDLPAFGKALEAKTGR